MSLQNFIRPPRFEEYGERFKDFYKMERRPDGVILVQAHTKGGPIQLSVENHRSALRKYLLEMEVPLTVIDVMTSISSGQITRRIPASLEYEMRAPPSIAEWIRAKCGEQ
jgi:hypothetical protein